MSDKKVHVISVPYDSGFRNSRMGRGPDAVLASGLIGALEALGATVSKSIAELPPDARLSEIGAALALQRIVAGYVRAAIRNNAFPLVLAGNCNTAVGSVAGMTSDARKTPAIYWFDAHADFNTPESTPTGFVDGMAMAMLTGRCWRRETAKLPGFRPVQDAHVVLIGTRDIDASEQKLLRTARFLRVSAEGVNDDLRRALAALPADVTQSYLHVDLDVLDPSVGCANGFSADGGLAFEDLLDAFERIRHRSQISAVAITAFDPAFDQRGALARKAVQIAVQLVYGAVSAPLHTAPVPARERMLQDQCAMSRRDVAPSLCASGIERLERPS